MGGITEGVFLDANHQAWGGGGFRLQMSTTGIFRRVVVSRIVLNIIFSPIVFVDLFAPFELPGFTGFSFECVFTQNHDFVGRSPTCSPNLFTDSVVDVLNDLVHAAGPTDASGRT